MNSDKNTSDLLKKLNQQKCESTSVPSLNILNCLGSSLIKSHEFSINQASQMVLQTPSKYSTRSCFFINTSPEEKLFELVKNLEILRKLPESSTESVYSNHKKRYYMRPVELTDIHQANWHPQYVLMSRKCNVEVQSDDEVSDGSSKTIKTQVTFKLSIGEVVRYITDSSHLKTIRHPQFCINTEPELQLRELPILFYPHLSNDYELLKHGFLTFRVTYLSVTTVVERKGCKYEHTREYLDIPLAEIAAEVSEDHISTGCRIAPNVTQYDDENTDDW